MVNGGDLYGIGEVLEGARALGPRRMAVVCPYDGATLESATRALASGVAQPVLIGRADTIGGNAKSLGLDLSGMEVVESADEQAPELAAAMFHDGRAHFIMKGMVGTGRFIQVLLDPRWGIRTDRILSHAGLFEINVSRRLFLMSDGAINILPNFNRKVQILHNAVEAARKLGIARIRVAMLAAVEKVTLPAMPATLDAFLMKKFSGTGFFGECAVDGPFALDNAIDPSMARTKCLGGEVAGNANVVIVPNIETGNVIWKSVTAVERREAAGVVLGGACPIVVPSRSDNARTKLLSIQFARLLMG